MAGGAVRSCEVCVRYDEDVSDLADDSRTAEFEVRACFRGRGGWPSASLASEFPESMVTETGDMGVDRRVCPAACLELCAGERGC